MNATDVEKIIDWQVLSSREPEKYGPSISMLRGKFSDKFWGIEYYFETRTLSIIESTYKRGITIVHNWETQKTVMFYQLIDDITNGINPRINSSSTDYLVSFIDINSQKELIASITKGSIKIDDKEKQRLLKFEVGSNPILLLYKVKSGD